jgi:cobalt/nickel transport system permease protein
MHIPDGFISPKLYVPAYAAAAGLWAVGARRIKRRLSVETIPQLAVVTALSFVLMMIALPFPGGTSVHATGIALLAVIFGVWTAFLSISLVLLIQALFFGIGGITSLPVNALAMGMAGSVAAVIVFRAVKPLSERAGLVAAGWAAVCVSAFLTAVALGLQPALAHSETGIPLFFPFGLDVTLPAIMLPHLFVGVGEGVLTLFAYSFFKKLTGGPRA